MEENILKKLARLKEIEVELEKTEISQNPKLYRELTQEHALLFEIKEYWEVKRLNIGSTEIGDKKQNKGNL